MRSGVGLSCRVPTEAQDLGLRRGQHLYAGTLTRITWPKTGGELIRYHVRVGTARVVVKQANRYGTFLPEVGSHVVLMWSPEDAVVFPMET